MYACMYVCMNECMYACMYEYVCMYVCMYPRMSCLSVMASVEPQCTGLSRCLALDLKSPDSSSSTTQAFQVCRGGEPIQFNPWLCGKQLEITTCMMHMQVHLSSQAQRVRELHTATWAEYFRAVSQSASEPTNQPPSQPANQPTNQPTTQPTNQPTNHSWSVSSPAAQPTSWSVSSPATQPTSISATQSASHPDSQPATEPASQPTN
jgi:hypothetical protein